MGEGKPSPIFFVYRKGDLVGEFDIRNYMVARNYILNKNFGSEPYVHKYSRNYEKSVTSGAMTSRNMYNDAVKIYNAQADRLDQRFKRQNRLTAEQADKAMEILDDTFNKLTSSAALKKKVQEVSAFQSGKYDVAGKSIRAYSMIKGNREGLMKDIDKLVEFVDQLSNALDKTYKPDEGTKAALMSMMGEDVIPDKEHFRNMTIIGSDKGTDTNLKKLITATEQLKKYVKQRTTGLSAGISDIDADEIVRGLAGSINGVQGGLFEVALPSVINNGRNKIVQELKKSGVIMGASMSGASTVKSSKSDKMVVSKSDVKVEVNIGEMDASMSFGLNLKTTKKDELGLEKKSTFVGKANLGDLLARSNSINTDTVYHIANMATHNTFPTDMYAAARLKLGALTALEVLTGLGNSSDSALYIVYTNKAIRISTFLRQMATKKSDMLKVSLTGVKSVVAVGDMELDRYVRSHKELLNVINNVKVTVTG